MQISLPPLLAVGLIALAISPASADTAPETDRLVVKNVRLAFDEDASPQTIVIRNGRIEQIVSDSASLPAGARVIDGAGRIAQAAFVDAWSLKGFEPKKPVVDQDDPVDVSRDVRVDMRLANRKGIQPSLRAADHLALSADAAEGWRKAGFGAALFADGGELLSGTSVVATTRSAPRRDVIVRPDVFFHAVFRASGGGYPSTLMGYHAQLRQFFLDARRHHELSRRYSLGLPDPRPPFDRDLDAIAPVLKGEVRVVCEAQSHRDIARWIRLADELGVQIAIADGREAWRVADLLAARDIPVILSLDWGEEAKDPLEKKDTDKDKDEEQPETDDEGVTPETVAEPDVAGDLAEERVPEVPLAELAGAVEEPTKSAGDAPEGDAAPNIETWEYETPLGVRIDQRDRWEERRDNALRLHEAGVHFVFGSGGDKPEDLIKRVRTAVEAGLPKDVAREALTRGAATLLGVDDRLGALAVGKDATFAIWTADPLGADAQLAWIFIDGVGHELEVKEKKDKDKGKGKGDPSGGAGPSEGVDVSGQWLISFVSPQSEEESSATLKLQMAEDGVVTGTLTLDNPMTGEPYETETHGRLAGAQLSLESVLSFGDFELTLAVDATLDGDEFDGELTFSGPFGERATDVKGEREPKEARG